MSTKSNPEGSKAPYRTGTQIRDLVITAMLGALMFSSKIVMEILPNIHLLGMLIIASTVVFRTKALLSIYVYVFLDGLIHGFNIWWYPYLYIWTILWGAAMLLPKRMPKRVCVVVYPLLCALHGFLFGVLYAPAQMLFFSLTVEETIAWIAAGFAFDVTHGVSNFCMGLLIFPLVTLMRRLLKKAV